MTIQEGRFESNTGQQIYHWEIIPSAAPKAIIQIVHGMAEYSTRYRRFAQFLADQGYIVAAHDHAGHGLTVSDENEYGFFAEKPAWQAVIGDVTAYSDFLRENYPDLPLVLLGHSMGSFMLRHIMLEFPNHADAWIISGTGIVPAPLVFAGKLIVAWQSLFHPLTYRSRILHNMSFASNNKRFENEKIPNAWLGRNTEEVQKYNEDQWCGGGFTLGFYRDLFTGLKKIRQYHKLQKLSPETPVLIFSGGDDPVGDYGKAPVKLKQIFEKQGLKNLTCNIYPGGRHEMLNEINKDEVYQDILEWIKTHLK